MHGADTWLPIPDVAEAAGMAPEAAERLLRDMAGTNEVLMESCLALGIKDERYKREGVERGWWPAVKLLPKEVVEARRRAILEWTRKREKAQDIVSMALHSAYPDAPWKVEVQEDGRVVIRPEKDDTDARVFVDVILALDTTGEPQARSGERSHRRQPRG